VEREVKDLNAEDRLRIRQDMSLPLVQTLHEWLIQSRQKVPEGLATAKAIDYSLRRWKALTRFLQDGQLPVDNNWIEVANAHEQPA
jgi:transposase